MRRIFKGNYSFLLFSKNDLQNLQTYKIPKPLYSKAKNCRSQQPTVDLQNLQSRNPPRQHLRSQSIDRHPQIRSGLFQQLQRCDRAPNRQFIDRGQIGSDNCLICFDIHTVSPVSKTPVYETFTENASIFILSPAKCFNTYVIIKVSKHLTLDEFRNMLIGYARVSTSDQRIELQIDALTKAGCDRIFTDEGVSGSKTSRPELDKALDHLRKGDCLVVWKLDRLGRSLPHLIETVGDLETRGIQFRSLQETIDTSTPGGKLVFHVFCSLAEFERDLIKERTNAGLAAARARGRHGGRPSVLTPEQVKMGKTLAGDRTIPIAEICKQLGCSRATYYRQIAPLVKTAA